MKLFTKKIIFFSSFVLVGLSIFFVWICLFFDEVLFVRKSTIYHVDTPLKMVALTFDDGPSPEWTPKILAVLKENKVKATFFMLGRHVKAYPQIARMVVAQGSEVGNHTYNHMVIFNSSTVKLEKEIKDTEKAIKEATGLTPVLMRPPKGWVTDKDKKLINKLGYETILWSLNSKDWVTFDDKYIVKFIMARVKPGDIILFHDSGGFFGTEGGNRDETVRAVSMLVEKLKARGFVLTTVSELLASRNP
ncbi:MAG: polysaccharide deacetylase family protein [Candidatus Omnitrophica bacterium]|nr:polysaccharide deacetylase family protein [Candidatus Omnitrophota bacterium]